MINEDQLKEIFEVLQKKYKNDWLLALELYELAFQKDFLTQKVFLKHLQILKENDMFTKLISDGLELIRKNI